MSEIPPMLEQHIYHLYFISMYIALLTPILLFHHEVKWSSRFSYRVGVLVSVALQVPVFVLLVATLSNAWPGGLPPVRIALVYGWLMELGAFFGIWYHVIRKMPRQRITNMQQPVSA